MPSKLRRHDEYGHIHFLTISCYRRLRFFRHDPVRQVFVDGMTRTRAKLGIRWVGYVVMPEHVHLLLFPMPIDADEPVRVSTVLHNLKQYVGRQGKEALRSIWRDCRSLGSPPMDAWALGSGAKPFWKTRAYDFNVTTEKTLLAKLDYVHKNPITRRLVERADQWVWSSYRYYEYDDDSVIAMDWDGSWPIV
ncbi:MAG: transposase [Phycisphaerales bacterium]|nr:MAG: transposase [Phycisphaerales bacterium]